MEGSTLVQAQHDMHFASSVSTSIFTALHIISSKSSATTVSTTINRASFPASSSNNSSILSSANAKSLCDSLDATVQALLSKCEHLPTFPSARDLSGVKSVVFAEELTVKANMDKLSARFVAYEEKRAQMKREQETAAREEMEQQLREQRGSSSRGTSPAPPSAASALMNDDDDDDDGVTFATSDSRPGSPTPDAPPPIADNNAVAPVPLAPPSAPIHAASAAAQQEDNESLLEQSVAARALRYVASFTTFDPTPATTPQKHKPDDTLLSATTATSTKKSAAAPPPPKPYTPLERSCSNFEASFSIFLLAVTSARSYLSILAPLFYDVSELKTHWLNVVGRPSSFFYRWFLVDPWSAGRSFWNLRLLPVQHTALEHVAQLQKLEQELMEVIGSIHVALQSALYRAEEVAAQCSEFAVPVFDAAAAAAAADEKTKDENGENDDEDELEEDPLLTELHHAALTLLRNLVDALRRIRVQQENEEENPGATRATNASPTAAAAASPNQHKTSPSRSNSQQHPHFHFSDSGTEPNSATSLSKNVVSSSSSQFAPPQSPISDAFGSTAAAPASAAALAQPSSAPTSADVFAKSQTMYLAGQQSDMELFNAFSNAAAFGNYNNNTGGDPRSSTASPDQSVYFTSSHEQPAGSPSAKQQQQQQQQPKISERNLLAEHGFTDISFLLHQLSRFCSSMDRHLHRVRRTLSQRAAWSIRSRVFKSFLLCSVASGCFGIWYLRKKQLTLAQVLHDYVKPTGEAFVVSLKSYVLAPVVDLVQGLLAPDLSGAVDEAAEREVYAKMVRSYHEDLEARRVADANARTFDLQGFAGFSPHHPPAAVAGSSSEQVAATSPLPSLSADGSLPIGDDFNSSSNNNNISSDSTETTSAATAIAASHKLTEEALDVIAAHARETTSDEKITTDFIEGVRRPLKALLFGQLVRLLLIDVQRQKVDLAHIMSQSEDVMKKQDLTFRMFALFPIVVAVTGVFVVRSITKASVEQPLRKELLASWRALHSVVTKASGGQQQLHPSSAVAPISSSVSVQQQQQQHPILSNSGSVHHLPPLVGAGGAATPTPRSPHLGPFKAPPFGPAAALTSQGGGDKCNSTGGGPQQQQSLPLHSNFHVEMGSILLILYRMKMLGRALRKIRGESEPPSRSWAEATARVGSSVAQHQNHQQQQQQKKKKSQHHNMVFTSMISVVSDWMGAFENDLQDLEDHRATREQRLLVLERMVATYNFLGEKLDG